MAQNADPSHAATRIPALLDVPTRRYLMVDGHGDPNTSEDYAACVRALFTTSYAVRFALRRTGTDAPVGPLEGLWSVPDMADFSVERKGEWDWTMMIGQPAAITPDDLDPALAKASAKVGAPVVGRLRLEELTEVLCAQVLHVGPYAAEAPTIAGLHAFLAEQGLRPSGRHHEIYLGDPERTAPERLRTVLRQPVASAH